MATIPPDLRTATVLDGRFRVMFPLAAGGMASVYIAHDEELGGEVAVKLLEPVEENHALLRQLIVREAEAMERVRHEHVVGLVGHGPLPDGAYYIAMDYIPSAKALTAAFRDPSDGVGILGAITQLCEALAAVHQAGFVHRDLKASNVLVSGGVVTLIDFGLVQRAQNELLPGEEYLIGGFQTVSPEQIRGEVVDARADVYSVAALSYRLLSGRYPFHSKLPAEVIARHLKEPPPSLPTALRHPSAVDTVLQKALSKSPADRYPSVQAFQAALAAALERPRWSGWRVAAGGLVLVFLGVVLLGLWFR